MTEKKTYMAWISYAAVAVFTCAIFWRYITICGSHVPIMDFFKWISFYGETVHSGDMSFAQFFYDVNEQVQPGALALNFLIMEKSGYDMWPMMVIGTVLQCMKAIALGASVLVAVRKQKNGLIWGWLGAVAVTIAMLNQNQWELMTEPFTVGMAVRCILFLLTFNYASYLFQHILEKSYWKQVAGIIILSVLSFAVSLSFAAAYFTGFLGAISIAGIIFIIDRRKEIKARHIGLAVIWGCTVLVTLAVYLCVAPSSEAADISVLFRHVSQLLKSLILYYGAAIVPQQLSEGNPFIFYFFGVVALIATVVIAIMYLAKKELRKQLFPVMLVVYGAITGLVIAVGRISVFGQETMMSSRYCTESILGICGTVIMGVRLCSVKSSKRKGYCLAVSTFALLVISSALLCNAYEMQIAPYRAIYQDGIVNAMKNAEYLDDDQLLICQAEPLHVREAVQFLRKNELSIFSKGQESKEIYSLEDVTNIEGIDTDNWSTASSCLGIPTGQRGIVKIDIYIPFDLSDNACINVSIDGEHYKDFPVTSGGFTLEIQTEPNTRKRIGFTSNFEFINPPDVRSLSFLITSLQSY